MEYAIYIWSGVGITIGSLSVYLAYLYYKTVKEKKE